MDVQENLIPDGTHLLMAKPEDAMGAANEIRVIFNWFEELERLAPTSGN